MSTILSRSLRIRTSVKGTRRLDEKNKQRQQRHSPAPSERNSTLHLTRLRLVDYQRRHHRDRHRRRTTDRRDWPARILSYPRYRAIRRPFVHSSSPQPSSSPAVFGSLITERDITSVSLLQEHRVPFPPPLPALSRCFRTFHCYCRVARDNSVWRGLGSFFSLSTPNSPSSRLRPLRTLLLYMWVEGLRTSKKTWNIGTHPSTRLPDFYASSLETT